MTFFFVLAVLVAIAALAPVFGADSRDLRDPLNDGATRRIWY
jgi:hypothetical protein